MLYPEEVIQKVRESNDIVEVISDYVQLERRGQNYFGLCPFHSEKTPSFSVNVREQFYYCFGCHEGGNVITFIMKVENVSFAEALKILADRAHIVLPEAEMSEEEKRRQNRRSRMLEAARETAVFYYYQRVKTEEGKRAQEYLAKRQVTDQYAKKFGLGYAPISSDMLYRFLTAKGYSVNELTEAGLLSGKGNRVYDRFFNRVMFPIFDASGRTIAFGGRIMGQGEPKYLNSPDSELFNKRFHLYGLSLAKKSRRKYLMMVEGYMDVLSLHQAGFDNAVASLGTALTEQQAKLMKRYTDQVVLCYDSDAAGTSAAKRAIPILEKAGLDVKVMQVPGAKDPDEFIKDSGGEAFEKVIAAAMTPMDFYLLTEQKENGSSADGLVKTTRDMIQRLAEVESDVERQLRVRDVAAKLRVDENSLMREVEDIRHSAGLMETRSQRREREKQERNLFGEQNDSRGMLLASLLKRPEIYKDLKGLLSVKDFAGDEEDTLYYRAAEYVFGCLENGQRPVLTDLVSRFETPEEQSKVSRFSEMTVPDEKENLEKFLTQNLQNLKKRQMEEAIDSDDLKKQAQAVEMKKQLDRLEVHLS